MKTSTESIVNSISSIDMQNYIDGIKEVTEKYLYHCAKEGANPEFGYNALINVKALLKEMQGYQSLTEKKVA